MAKSKFFSNSKTHWKIIFFKNFKITKHVTTQDHRVQLNYLRFKNQKIPGHKYISPLWKNSDNSFDKNLKISKLVTTQENRAQYLKIKNLKIHGHKNISSFWRKPDKSLDKFSFGGFRIFKKLKPSLRSAENIASSPLDLTTYSHELISTSPLTTTLTPPPPSNWMNYLGFLSLDDQDTDGELPLLVSLRLPLPPSQLPLTQAIEPEYPSLTTMAFKPKRKPFKYSRISIWRNQLQRLNDSYGKSWTEEWDADWEDITVSPKSSALHDDNATSPSTKSLVTTDSHELSPTSLDSPLDNSLLIYKQISPSDLFIDQKNSSLRPTMLPDVNKKSTPTLSPTEVPKGTPTEGQETTPFLTHAALPVLRNKIPSLVDDSPSEYLWDLASCEASIDQVEGSCECSCEASLDQVDTPMNSSLLPPYSDVTIIKLPDSLDPSPLCASMHTSPESQWIPLNPHALDYRPPTLRLPLATVINRPLLAPGHTHLERQWSALNPYLLDFIPTSFHLGNLMTPIRIPLNPLAQTFRPITLDHLPYPTHPPPHPPSSYRYNSMTPLKASLHRNCLTSFRRKTSRLHSCQHDFSLSVNERRRRPPHNANPRQTETKKREHGPFLPRRNYCPHSTARRRLLRTTWRSPPSPLRTRCKYRQTTNNIRPIHLPSEIDHSSSNKKLDKNKTTTDSLPCFDFSDVLPKYKIYLYWEVRAG